MAEERGELSDNPPPTSWEVFQWPEFQALIKRLGVKVQRTKGITIILGPKLHDLVQVVHTFQGEDNPPAPDRRIETTNLTNKEHATHRPI